MIVLSLFNLKSWEMSTAIYQLDTFLITVYSLYCTKYLKLLFVVLMVKVTAKVFLFSFLLFFFTLFQIFGQENTSFLTQQEVVEGNFLVYFIDDSEEIINSPTVTFPTTNYSFDSQISSSILAETERTIRIDNVTSNNYIDLAIAPDLSSTGNFTNDAKWFSTGKSYPIYSDNSEDGRLIIDPISSSFVATGCQPNLLNLGTTSHFLFLEPEHENNIESIDLITFSSVSTCRIDLQGIDLIQTIPPLQAPGFYELEMIITATATQQSEPTNAGYPYLQWQDDLPGPVYSEAQITNMISADGYIPIANAEELNNIRNDSENIFGLGTIWENTYVGGLNEYYVQVADIDLSEIVNISPVSEKNVGWIPIGMFLDHSDNWVYDYFMGKYDGNGYNISNLSMDWEEEPVNSVGLFANIRGPNAIIRNINISHANVFVDTGPSGILAGRIEGWEGDNVLVENCSIKGTITANDPAWNIGGLTGESFTSQTNLIVINKCYVDASISSTDASGIFIGVNGGTIKNSYSRGMITGVPYNNPSWISGEFGGFVGVNYGYIENSYSAASMNMTEIAGEFGGFAGSDWDLGDFSECYYDSDVSNQSDTGMGEPKTTNEMKNPATFINIWDFQTIWTIDN
jgi:hypothetical protein